MALPGTEISRRFVGNSGREYARRFNETEKFVRLYQVNYYFAPWVGENDDVLDLGCGDGLFLRTLHCRKRMGVEINDAARELCEQRSEHAKIAVQLHRDISQVADAAVDVVISNHCLEHVINPYGTLTQVLRVLRPGGRLVLVTPFDDWRGRIHGGWSPNDPDNHLFTWSPRNIGNLVVEAGFSVQEVLMYRFACSPRLRWVLDMFGRQAFRAAGRALALYRQTGEVMVRAQKPCLS
jgi:SAM-dependent methyltransferase